jgi:beta-galactosidase/beta-glucuronidase
MTNRILDLVVHNHRLDPIETELRVYVRVAQLTAATQIRGRLVGPRSEYATTVEIAYPLRESARDDHIELRVLIPEPNWWSPQSPFLYTGAIELFEGETACERVPISHGIRTLQLNANGLKLNGKPLTLRAVVASPAMDMHALRAAGFNALLTKITDAECDWWESADRLGFLVIATADNPAAFAQCRHELAAHPSAFGWVFNRAELQSQSADVGERDFYFGVNTSALGAPPNADFLVCSESELGWLDASALPKLVVVKRLPEPLPVRADVIGWISLSARDWP